LAGWRRPMSRHFGAIRPIPDIANQRT
jgi:hypothetical protein